MASTSDSVLRSTLIERAGHLFPHPYFDIASQYVPKNIKDAFSWAEYLYYKVGTYHSATNRIVRYLLTDLKIHGEKTESTEWYEDVFKGTNLNLKGETILGGTDLLVYGNHFASVYLPFDRCLLCPACGLERKATQIKYEFKNLDTFEGKCQCGKKVKYIRKDRPIRDVKRVKIIRWDPKQIELQHHPLSQEARFFWKIPAKFAARIKQGDRFLINTTPWEIIETIKQNRIFEFAHDQVFHRKMPSLAGLSPEWGIPPCMAIFTLSWYVAILRRMNEAIANDFVVPFRVIYPGTSSSSSDPATFIPMGNFVGRMKRMVKDHRRDPADMQISPIPIGYQAMGAEGKALDLSENIKGANEEILNALGYPSELWYGTLSVQALPAALRMFENNWHFLTEMNNSFVQWVAARVAEYFDKEKIEIEYERVSIADDIERRQIMMQLASSQKISDMSFLERYGLDYKQEQLKLLQQQQIMQDVQAKGQELAEEQAQANTGEQGQGAGNAVYDVVQRAQSMAEQMLAMDETSRRQELRNVAMNDETLHALVKQKMEAIRNQMMSQAGQDALRQGQMVQGQGGVTGGGLNPPPPPPPGAPV
jgi:hypothetical protein